MASVDLLIQDVFRTYILPIIVALFILTLTYKYTIGRRHSVYKQFCRQLSELYEELTVGQKRDLFRGLEQQAQVVDRPLRVLELGVETGQNFLYYPDGCDVVCLDHDPDIDIYIRKYIEEEHPHIRLLEFVAGGGEVLAGIGEACLDAVVMTHTLCSETDPLRTIIDIHRILRPKGQFYFMEHTKAKRWTRIYFQQKFLQPVYHMTGFPCRINRDTVKLVKSVFGNVQVKRFTLNLADHGLTSKLLLPPWLRYQVAGAAIR